MIRKTLRYNIVIIFLFISIVEIIYSQNVGIGDASDFTPDNSAILELRSVIRGFLMPQMTAAQKNAISNPAHGLMIVQTDDQIGEPNGIWYYDSIDEEWKNIFTTSTSVFILRFTDRD